MARCWKARVNVARKKRRAKVGSERISMLVGQFSADGSAVDLGANVEVQQSYLGFGVQHDLYQGFSTLKTCP